MTLAHVPVAHADSLGGAAHGIVKTILSPVTAGAGALAGLGLSAVVGWVLGGTSAALRETAHLIGRTTAPQLTSAWFSSTYWHVAGLATLLTLPFLAAAAVQSLIRSDLAMLLHATLVHLPLAVIGVSLAAPVVMLLLAATDEMCTTVAGAATSSGSDFLLQAAGAAAGLSAIDGSPFFAAAVGLCTAAAALALMMEMLVREAAVYVVVLMLPLVFAAFVWPARRMWAVRLIELLAALILSKFVIVAVLSLAGAAYGGPGAPATARVLTAMALVLLATMAPWALVRLLPFTELAADAAGALSGRARGHVDPAGLLGAADPDIDWGSRLTAAFGRPTGGDERSPAGPTGQGTDSAGGDVPLGAAGAPSGRSAGAPAVKAPEGAAGAPPSTTAPGGHPGDTNGGDIELGVGSDPDARVGGPASPNGDGAGPGGAGTPGAGSPIDAGTARAGSAPRERRPGMEPIWQAANSEWPHFAAGPTARGPSGFGGPSSFEPPAPGDGPGSAGGSGAPGGSTAAGARGLPAPLADDLEAERAARRAARGDGPEAHDLEAGLAEPAHAPHPLGDGFGEPAPGPDPDGGGR